MDAGFSLFSFPFLFLLGHDAHAHISPPDSPGSYSLLGIYICLGSLGDFASWGNLRKRKRLGKEKTKRGLQERMGGRDREIERAKERKSERMN